MLREFLLDVAGRPFVWGQTDCALVIAEWWALNHGADPAAHLRGTYSTEEECLAVMERHGGVLKLVTELAEKVGAPLAVDYMPGDFGVVSAHGLSWGAIRTESGRWFIKARKGVAVVSHAHVSRGWAIQCR